MNKKILYWEETLPPLFEKREKIKTFLNLWREIDRDFKKEKFYEKIRKKKIKISVEIANTQRKIMIYKKRAS